MIIIAAVSIVDIGLRFYVALAHQQLLTSAISMKSFIMNIDVSFAQVNVDHAVLVSTADEIVGRF